MAKTKVCVIFGGVSNEHEVSLMSAKSIIDNIPTDKYDVVKIGITKKGRCQAVFSFIIQEKIAKNAALSTCNFGHIFTEQNFYFL